MPAKTTTSFWPKHLGKDFLVGLFFLGVVGLLVVFGYLMGMVGGFRAEARYVVRYDFAGGVEVGSPVRVAGVKVGKVERIEFFPERNPDPSSLRVTISVSQRASESVRKDSQFYINMAGIIGERYVEVSPGLGERLAPGTIVRGIDPPRIDQLLSQGYGVFGKLQDFLNDNEATLSSFVTNLNVLLKDANKLMAGGDKHRLLHLVDNLDGLTTDLRGFTTQLHAARAKHFFDRLESVLEKADSVDKSALKKFLQDEGIRAHMF